MPTFTVALMGPPFFGTPDMWLGDRYEEQDFETPYQDRPKAEVEADEHETLAVIIDRAADDLGIHPNPAVLRETAMSAAIGGIAFYYEPTDDVAYRRDRAPGNWPQVLLIPGPTREQVEKRWQDVTVAELLAASKAGLLYGDPLRPYLYPGFPQGDFFDPHWLPPAIDAVRTATEVAHQHVPTAREVADDALRAGGILGGIAALWAGLRRRLRRRRRYKSPWNDV
jgi:hypothetical protein